MKEAKLDNIITEYSPLLASICRKLIKDPFIAEEAIQNIWLIITEKIHQFRGDSKISTWLYTIARREALRISKDEKRWNYEELIEEYHQGNLQYPPDLEEEEYEWVKKNCNACLTGMVATLKPEERLGFLLRYMGDCSYREIGEVLQKSEAACRQFITRAKAKFMKFIEDECAYFDEQSKCHCGLADPVKRHNIANEFFAIRKMNSHINLLKEWDQVLPHKEWWLK